jgi:hypothetical protein
MEADRDGAAAESLGQSMVVVPTELARLVAVAVRSNPRELGESHVAGLGELPDANGATACVELDVAGLAVRQRDGLGLEPDALLRVGPRLGAVGSSCRPWPR